MNQKIFDTTVPKETLEWLEKNMTAAKELEAEISSSNLDTESVEKLRVLRVFHTHLRHSFMEIKIKQEAIESLVTEVNKLLDKPDEGR